MDINQNVLQNNIKTHKRSNFYILIVIVAAIVSIVCLSIIVGIWYWLYSTGNIGREEHKTLHIAIFSLAIIDVVFMAMWIAAMIANIIVFIKTNIKNKLRYFIHYICVLALYVIFGCIAFALLAYVVTWKIMDDHYREVAKFFVGFLELLRILMLISILVTSFIYLHKNKNNTTTTNTDLIKQDITTNNVVDQSAPTTI